MNVSSNYRCLFLFLLVLAVYFPSITSVVNSVDDVHIISAYGINGPRTLRQILLPGNQFYFRPAIELTYYLDNILWGLDPSFMHLENILLHGVNTVLVYLFAVEVSALAGGSTGLPFLSALLFAVHPVNSEPVSWIAGRTDPLAAFFILISLLFLFKALQNGRIRYAVIAVASMLLSFFVKETSFVLMPVSVLLVYSVKPGDVGVSSQIIRIRKWVLYPCLALFISSVLYASVRYVLKPAGSDNAFSMLFRGDFNVAAFLRDLCLVTGFSLKKLIVPFPLNFAIDSISVWYIVPGIAALVACLLFVRNRTIVSSLAASGIFFTMPAVVVKFAGITWTPFAERYLYISSFFFSICLSISIIYLLQRTKWKIVISCLLLFLVCGATIATFQRNNVWRSNLSLFQDAVRKSPDFGDIHNELGVALSKNGECLEARKHFVLAHKYSKRPLIREYAELNLLGCELNGKSLDEKKDILKHYVASHEYVQPDILRLLRNIMQQLAKNERDITGGSFQLYELIELNDRIYRETKDALCLYSNGQIMMALENNDAALDYFRKAIAIAPPDAYYYKPALKMIHQLEKK